MKKENKKTVTIEVYHESGIVAVKSKPKKIRVKIINYYFK